MIKVNQGESMNHYLEDILKIGTVCSYIWNIQLKYN